MKAREHVEAIVRDVGESFGYDEAEALRAHLTPTAHLLEERGADETTEWTNRAKAEGRRVVAEGGLWAEVGARTAQFVEVAGELLVLELVGQAPDQRAYRQGLSPERLRFLLLLERSGIPVLLAFFHGRWEIAWLETLPEPEAIARTHDGLDNARVGWYAGDDPDKACFWISEDFRFPPRELPREEPFVATRLTDGLG